MSDTSEVSDIIPSIGYGNTSQLDLTYQVMFRLTFILFLFCTVDSFSQRLTVKELQLKIPAVSYCTPVKDQFMSSTCWSFASNAVLESELLKKGKSNIDLSEMFVARYSYLRKIHRHLKLRGGNFFTPGGQFHDVVWVMKNHGMVPESAYPGKPNGIMQHDHAELDTLIAHFIRSRLKKGMTILSPDDEKYVNDLFDKYLGTVPTSFTYEDNIYTPQSFLERVLEINPDDYVEITSYTHHPFYESFVLEDKYNWTGDTYHNVPLDDFSTITNYALANGYTVGWDGDADDPGFDFYTGIAYLDGDPKDYPVYRQKAFEDQTTLLDHMMQVVGTSNDKYGRTWYYIKNSWGSNTNKWGGFLFMSEDYFKVRTVAIIVNKNAIPAAIRKKMRL